MNRFPFSLRLCVLSENGFYICPVLNLLTPGHRHNSPQLSQGDIMESMKDFSRGDNGKHEGLYQLSQDLNYKIIVACTRWARVLA